MPHVNEVQCVHNDNHGLFTCTKVTSPHFCVTLPVRSGNFDAMSSIATPSACGQLITRVSI